MIGVPSTKCRKQYSDSEDHPKGSHKLPKEELSARPKSPTKMASKAA